jgi:hypothetical protein
MRPSFITLAACSLFVLSAQLATGAPAETKAAADGMPEALQGPGLLKVTYDKYPRITKEEAVSRSPCPFLNSAANHGILPYSGKGIKLTWLKALLNKVGLSDRSAKPFIDGMSKVIEQAKKKNPSHGDDYIDLSDLNAHGIIEHDGSLTRDDILDANTDDLDKAAKPNFKLIGNMFAHISKMSGAAAGSGLPEVTYSGIASWRKKRLADEALRKNADGTPHKPSYYLSRAFILGSGECALLLEVLGNGSISGKNANLFLAKETFPDGWQAKELSQLKLLATMSRCGIDSALVPDTVHGWIAKWTKSTKNDVPEAPPTDNAFRRAWRWAFGGKDQQPPQ